MMWKSRLVSSLIVVLQLAVAVGCLPSWLSAKEREAADAGRVAQWIQQLDSDQFVARETATLRLIEAGMPVVSPIADALDGESLEVTTRGIYVLRELALSNDLDLQEAAQTALEQVSLKSTSAARRADDTLRTLAGIRQERALSELRELGAHVSATLRQIGFQTSELTSIEIGDSWRGTPQDLRRLKWLSEVQQIAFSGDQAVDAMLQHVSGMKNLTSVVIKRTKITDAGIRYLRTLDDLRELDIKYTPIGDGSLESLVELKRLTVVKLYGTQLSPQAAAQLEEALPEADIDYRRGAFLGVACDQPPAPCTVVQVVPNTAAARAGLLEGDVIVEYAGKPVPDFNGLKELIATNGSGESVELKVARGGSSLNRAVAPGDRAALVGDKVKPHPLGLELTEVAEGSFGQRLGLRAGDVIRRVDTELVASVAAFHKAFEGLADGEEAELEIVRDARIVPKKVTFGEWE
jgi:hypothetical protein